MIEGDSGIISCSPPWFYPHYEPSKRRLTWPNGAVATTFSGDEPDQLRGPQFDSVWADEPAKWKYAQETWDNMEMGLRLGENPQAVATTTPRPIKLIRTLLADERTEKNPNGQTVVTRGHTDENRANLAEVYVARVIKRYEGTRLGRQELAGEVLDDNPHALWKRAIIDKTRLAGSLPDLASIVVAVDPQAADPKESDGDTTAETGIVAAGWNGSRTDPHFYVLEDRSVFASPNDWGSEAVTLHDKLKADMVVGEVNNGGAMVEFTVMTVARNKGLRVVFKAVHASRGKFTRAEPIAALYEQERVHHVGTHAALEDQMCEWMPGEKSPDRMDALVWALTQLAERAGLTIGDKSGWGTDPKALEKLGQRHGKA